MSNSVQKLKEQVEKYKNNPYSIKRTMLDTLVEIRNGEIDIVDATSPFVFCLESSAVLTASAISEADLLNRKQYAFSAVTPEDLYPHMSDKDYEDRFAIPSECRFLILMDEAELLSKLVVDSVDGIRKVVIPRNTYITVSDTVFSLQYPIEIRQMNHGGLQIVYDVSEQSPLNILNTNVLPWSRITSDTGENYIAFEIITHQFNIITKLNPINLSTAFVVNIDLDQKYYYCRVWVDNADGTFTEINTTHTDDVYDPYKPTAVLKVTSNRLSVKIPQVYINTGLINKSLRIDAYQTKGPININLGNFSDNQFKLEFKAINPAEENEFVAPLRSMKNIRVMSKYIAQGGKDEMSFSELREKVIKNAIGAPSLPITNVQIENALDRRGYKVVKNIDTITNRVFLATRSMPIPSNTQLITAASAGIGLLSTKMEDIINYDTVYDNGSSVTILPTTIYRLVSGKLQIVPKSEIDLIDALPVDQKAQVISTGNYFYSPFYYVLDTTQNEFDVRGYDLDDPYIENRSFVSENDTTLLQVSTATNKIEKIENGYKITISTTSSEAYKELEDENVYCVLAVKPYVGNDYAYVFGELIGYTDKDERVFEFVITTNYNVSSKSKLTVDSFKMFNQNSREIEIDLDSTFEIIHCTSEFIGNQWQPNNVDLDILSGTSFELPNTIKAITHERLKIHFGDYLDYLWSKARSVISELDYQKWEVDVPATYENDVFERDPVTGVAFTIVNGNLEFNVLHNAGDPVLDSEGNQIYKHRVGDIKLDNYGRPLIASQRKLLRQLDIMLVEGSYYFATDVVAQNYRKELVRNVVSWLVGDLPNMGKNLLEKTAIYYYPTTTIGPVKTLVDGGLVKTIDAGQSLTVRLHVRQTVINDLSLRDKLRSRTIKIINDVLQKSVVSKSEIIELLKKDYRDDVISFSFSGLGGVEDYDVVTMLDDSSRLSIKKKLVSRTDSTLILEEDVRVEFVIHQLDITA